MKIAVLITCYNRVQTTLKCLEHLSVCDVPDDFGFDIYLVDDNSPDRTGDRVKERFPHVRVIQGMGNLYWCGGMRLAWDVAAKEKEYDAFFWLNDDTFLYPDALLVIAHAARKAEAESGDAGIVVGATCDPLTKRTTYGVTGNPPRPPDGTLSPVQGETINGNAVWVSRKTWQRIGGFRTCFTHAMGDTDYGMRAMKAQIPVWLTPVHIGTCKANTDKRWDNPDHPIGTRWKMLHSVKGCPPKEFMQLVRVANPQNWPVYILKLYWRVLFPRNILSRRKRGERQ